MKKKKRKLKEKGVADLKNPENKYVLTKVVELPIEKFMDNKFLNSFCQNARLEYRRNLNKNKE